MSSRAGHSRGRSTLSRTHLSVVNTGFPISLLTCLLHFSPSITMLSMKPMKVCFDTADKSKHIIQRAKRVGLELVGGSKIRSAAGQASLCVYIVGEMADGVASKCPWVNIMGQQSDWREANRATSPIHRWEIWLRCPCPAPAGDWNPRPTMTMKRSMMICRPLPAHK